jgi:hypothetical protein
MPRNKRLIYHSALTSPATNLSDTDYVSINGNIAMYNNVTNKSLPIEYDQCDIMYTELSWVAGIKKFNQRSNESTSYQEYMNGVSNIIMNSKVPIIIVSGKKDGRYLPIPNKVLDINLNGAKAQCYLYMADIDGTYNTTIDLLNHLATKYNCIGDFCCGYGNSGYIFMQNGKNFVMSDYNKKCITYIKTWLNENI